MHDDSYFVFRVELKRFIYHPMLAWRFALGALKVDVRIGRGQERSGRGELSAFCCGSAQAAHYVFKLAFDQPYNVRHLGRVWLWQVPSVLRKAGADCSILVAETYRSCRWLGRRLLRSDRSFLVPSWVLTEIALPTSSVVMADPGVRSDMRRIRKAGLSYRVTRDESDLSSFHTRMYLPYVRRRHGECAMPVSYEHLVSMFASCELLLVTKNDEPIGGTVIVHEPSGPRLWLVGVLEGDQAHLNDGVVAATNHFAFEYLGRAGHSAVKLGFSRAFLSDGVLRFKRKWSPRVVAGGQYGLVLNVLRNTPGTRAFLLNNPFLFEANGQLHSAVFIDSEQFETPSSEHLYRKACVEGVSTVRVYRIDKGADTGGVPTTPVRVIWNRL
jgi:hypothetical protein